MRPFGHEHYPFSYQLTSWFCMEVSTTCYFSCTLVPLRASRCTFFPIHQLCCYIHRSYQWTLPHGSEQACLHEPWGKALVCRHSSFGSITWLILCKRRTAYRTINCPKFLYNCTLTGIEPVDIALYRAMLYPLYQRVLRLYVHVYKNSYTSNF